MIPKFSLPMNLMKRVNVYGASGHAKVIIDIINLTEDVAVVYDDNMSISFIDDLRVIHEIQNFENWVIAVGDNFVRKKICSENSFSYSTLIHPKAIISDYVKLGKGSVFMAGCVVNPSVSIGMHCIINTRASIDHECTLSDFVHISPGAILCGNVRIMEGTHVGAGAVILPGITIGKWSVIGAGAVIIKDVPDGVTVVGNPGRIL